MENEDFPALYRSADSGSNKAQRFYLNLVRAEFSLLFLAACVSAIRGVWAPAIFVLVVLVGLLMLLLVARYNLKLDEQWYKCRALAESIKTISWRFAMRAHPYEDAESVSVPTRRFLQKLLEIKSANEFIGDSLDEGMSDLDAIPDRMFEVRKMPLDERLAVYSEDRVKNQRGWYARKAGYNKRRRRGWFAAAIAVYVGSLLSLLSLPITGVDLSFGFDPLLVVVVSIFAWLQVKRHGELAASYLLTAHEIGLLFQAKDDATDEASLSDFVNEAEFAFSREHTQWVARQDAI